MATHSIHPNSHTNGLADGCERCEEHAEHPFDGLDDENLSILLIRVRNDDPPRSNNEALAMHRVRSVIRAAERLAKLG